MREGLGHLAVLRKTPLLGRRGGAPSLGQPRSVPFYEQLQDKKRERMSPRFIKLSVAMGRR